MQIDRHGVLLKVFVFRRENMTKFREHKHVNRQIISFLVCHTTLLGERCMTFYKTASEETSNLQMAF